MPRTWFDADAVEQVVDVAFRFARDSSLEEGGFEPSVPLTVDAVGGSSSSSPRHVKSKNATRASGPAVD
jgi:hypothetical protein